MPGLHCGLVLLLPIAVTFGTAGLILSMRLVSRVRGGVDFGEVEAAVFKAALLLTVVHIIQLFPPYGTWMALGAWLLGLFLLFRPDLLTTLALALINWYVNLALAVFLEMLPR